MFVNYIFVTGKLPSELKKCKSNVEKVSEQLGKSKVCFQTLSNINFRVFINEKNSNLKILENRLLQSASLPLFVLNLYECDLTNINFLKIFYAENLTLAHQDQNLTTVKRSLRLDCVKLLRLDCV